MSLKCSKHESGLECVFPADPSLVDEFTKLVSHLIKDKCSKKILFNISLVLRESLNNAVFHGAGGDSSLEISCSASLDKNKVFFEVRSPGPGFNWKSRLKKNPAGSTSHCGWGLFIIRQYADYFEFNEAGNILRFWMLLNDQQ
ncbi:MAG: ATP-binding protein [Desulfonatronovibrionaceae bacterium]